MAGPVKSAYGFHTLLLESIQESYLKTTRQLKRGSDRLSARNTQGGKRAIFP